jgi:hypothetical protein
MNLPMADPVQVLGASAAFELGYPSDFETGTLPQIDRIRAKGAAGV